MAWVGRQMSDELKAIKNTYVCMQYSFIHLTNVYWGARCYLALWDISGEQRNSFSPGTYNVMQRDQQFLWGSEKMKQGIG